jgi:hypothetical protein
MNKMFLSMLLLISTTGVSLAQTPDSSVSYVGNGDPTQTIGDPLNAPNLPSELKYLKDQGTTLTYLGKQDGIDGYLLEKDNVNQTCYLTPDGTGIICGILWGPGSLDQTGVQVHDLQEREKAVIDKQKKNNPDSLTGTTSSLVPNNTGPTSTTSTSASTNTITAPVSPQSSTNIVNENESLVKLPNTINSEVKIGDSNNVVTPLQSEVEGENTNYLSTLNKDSFLQQVNQVGWFSVGYPNTPIVYMIVDPQCPYCHAAWEKLAPMALAHKLTVKIIMIAGLPGSEPLAISILSQANPALAWEGGEGSTDGMEIPAPPAENTQAYSSALLRLTVNTAFAKNIGLNATPFLAYVGSDGNLYSVQGPKHLDKFLSHLN